MRLKYKSSLTFITLLILICIGLFLAYYTYTKYFNKNQSMVVADGSLSINYLDGNKLTIENEDKNIISFSVTNNDVNNLLYNIELIEINNTRNDLDFNLKGSNNININDKFPTSDMELSNLISINPNDTHNYKLTINNKQNKVEFRINIKLQSKEEVTFGSLILKDNEYKEKGETAVGEIAKTDEGLIIDIDDLGNTYYFRGKVTNNYVLFGGFTWRIVRINGDGTIKLIMNEALPTVDKYYTEDIKEYNYSEANVHNSLLKWYEENLKEEYEKYIKTYKYCSGDTADNDGEYFAKKRIITDKSPIFTCIGENITSKIGLITIDEIMFAGANTKTNKDYYLYNDKIENPYWTMSIYNKTSSVLYPFLVDTEGKIVNNVAANLYRNVRPVIVLENDLVFTGSGTNEKPYVLEEDN